MADRNQQLEIAVTEGRMIISIGVDLLAHAVSMADDWDEDWTIPDPDKFAAAMAHELLRETEVGDTPIHGSFDLAAMSLVEDGDESVHLPDDDA